MPTLTDNQPWTGRPDPAELADAFEASLDAFRARLDRELAGWIEERTRTAASETAEWAELTREATRLLAGGGKRLRPALVDAGYRACGGESEPAARRMAMATELLHTYLLVHDDIMDHARLRRGQPTVHHRFAERHREHAWPGDATDYGRSVAILAGDLLHTWAVELSRPGAEPEERAEGDPAAIARCFDAMCAEVIGGQFLEMTLPFRAQSDPPGEDELLRTLRLKSGRYSVERPLELGALLAGAGSARLEGLRRYGEAVGDAFQLQDDLLGTFGETRTVGKSVASDLEEGKYTFLIHHALAGASPEERSWLWSVLGRGELEPAEVDRARSILRSSGGLDAVVGMIDERLDRARRTVDELRLAEEDHDLFLGLVEYLARRDR